jgi:maltose O-acetyltransferase
MTGSGAIRLGKCNLGVWPSPGFINGYIHLEARAGTASVVIEDGVCINNNASIIAEKSSIHIGKNTKIGTHCTIYDSDFHDIDPDGRDSGQHSSVPVRIGENVFIGSGVTILKGVNIGRNSVIACGAIVVKSIPENSVAAGSPARVVRKLL